MYVPSHLFPSMLHVYACNTRFSYLATLVNAERHGWKIPYALRAMQLCVCIRMWVRMCQRVSVYVYRLRYRTVDRLPPWSTSTVGAEFSAERQTIAAKWLNCSQLNKCSPRFSLSLCMPERWSLVACRFFPTSPSLLFFSFLLSFFLSLLFPTRSCRGFPAAICRGTRDPGWTGPPRISSSSLSFPVLLSPLSLSLSLSLSLFFLSVSLTVFVSFVNSVSTSFTTFNFVCPLSFDGPSLLLLDTAAQLLHRWRTRALLPPGSHTPYKLALFPRLSFSSFLLATLKLSCEKTTWLLLGYIFLCSPLLERFRYSPGHSRLSCVSSCWSRAWKTFASFRHSILYIRTVDIR